MNVMPLDGHYVRLVPLDESHREPLRTAADDPRIWTHTLTCARGPGFDSWFDDAITESNAGRRVPFAIYRVAEKRWIGSTSYLDVVLRHRRIEIGATWYHPEAWGTRVNPECKLLLLTHAFEILKVNRVALLTDALNVRSRAAIAKLGAKFEGILRSHMMTQGDRIRDSVVFSIVEGEWPLIKSQLLARLTKAEA